MRHGRACVSWLRPVWLVGRAARLVGCGLAAFETATAAVPSSDFDSEIRPIFSSHCFSCHGPERQKSNLRLDRKIDVFKGGDGGEVLVPGRRADSRLFRFIAGTDPETVMPPKGGRLTATQIARIGAWIDAGAPWPDDPPAPDPRHHWAFLPPRRPQVPAGFGVGGAPRHFAVRNPIDAFVAAKHRQFDLAPAPEADRRTLMRRLSLDLLGLPPAPAEVEAFVEDPAPDAYERLVDRLLASPRYGERWGRHWLDLARWAETEGYEGNTFRSSAWRYRDYVVRAFNQDKPYDVFLREQLAGDELEPYADEQFIATGLLSSARYSHNEEDKAKQRNDILVDIANATATVTLGLTLACAQCHDHKFDPISLRDYYRWQGLFARGQLVYALLREPTLWREFDASMPAELDAGRRLRDLYHTSAEAAFTTNQLAALTPELRRLRNTPQEFLPLGQRSKPGELRKAIEAALPEDQGKLYAELMKRLDKLELARREARPQVWAFYSPASSPHTPEMLPPKGDYPLPYDPAVLKLTEPAVLLRGDPARRGAEVGFGWPEVLGAAPASGLGPKPRAAVAEWLTGTNSPLTTRVWVNYVWQQHFGRGLVATPSDFGVRGERPSHPELLDWLACELMAPASGPQPGLGWSTKRLHRLMVTSSTYRQAARGAASQEAIDPDNTYLWRWTPRRLEAEVIRDAALAVAGELDLTAGGPSLQTNLTDSATRRSIYLRQTRGDPPKVHTMFDGPSADESCTRRHVSTVPLQPLYLLNNPFWVRRAEALAARAYTAAGGDLERAAHEAFRGCLARAATAAESELAGRFFAAPANAGDARSALVRFCQALLSANEFLYIP